MCLQMEEYEFHFMVFPGGLVEKNLPAKQETQVQSLGLEDPLEKEMATHSSILAWEIPWKEEPGGLQSLGSWKSWTWLRGHDLEAKPQQLQWREVASPWAESSSRQMLKEAYDCLGDVTLFPSPFSDLHYGGSAGELLEEWVLTFWILTFASSGFSMEPITWCSLTQSESSYLFPHLSVGLVISML